MEPSDLSFSLDKCIQNHQEIDPYFIIRIIQLRHDRCSANHIADVLGLPEEIVLSVIRCEKEIREGFIKTCRSTAENAFQDYRHKTIFNRPTKRMFANFSERNFLLKRLESIRNYKGLNPSDFHYKSSTPYSYEIALIDRYRIYHLIRFKPEGSRGWYAERILQLLHEGFSYNEVRGIFEIDWLRAFEFLIRYMGSKLDRRNSSILKESIQKSSPKAKSSYAESLYLFDNSEPQDFRQIANRDCEFYMNINIGNGKIKSIRSIRTRL